MTANQIAFASTQESIRHNQMVEEETNRHNLATEQLMAEQNAINQEKVVLENSLGAEKNRIQEAYNNAYLEWTRSSGTEKLRLEAEKNSLQQQLIDVTDRYQIRSNELRAQENDIKERSYQEDVRSNQARETINVYSTMVNENLKLKELEFKQHELDVSSGLKAEEISQQGIKLDTEVYFKNASLALEQDRLDIYSSEVGNNMRLNSERIRWMPFQYGVDFFRAVGNLMH